MRFSFFNWVSLVIEFPYNWLLPEQSASNIPKKKKIKKKRSGKERFLPLIRFSKVTYKQMKVQVISQTKTTVSSRFRRWTQSLFGFFLFFLVKIKKRRILSNKNHKFVVKLQILFPSPPPSPRFFLICFVYFELNLWFQALEFGDWLSLGILADLIFAVVDL